LEPSSSKRKRIILSTSKKNKNKSVRRTSKIDLDEFSMGAIRRHVIGYYEKREVPTLRKLKESLRKAELFDGCIATLRKLLLKMGFKYQKFNKRKVLMEQPSVALRRCQFLRKMQSIDTSKAVFLDETWINANTSKEKGWTDGAVKCTLKSPLGKGDRLIICHAGGQNGWINAPPLVFKSKKLVTTMKKWTLQCLRIGSSIPYFPIFLQRVQS